jgi:hypothetical protein
MPAASSRGGNIASAMDEWEGINNKIKTLLRQTYGLRDERFFTLKLYSLHHSRLTLLG